MNRGIFFRLWTRLAAWIMLAVCRSYRITVVNPDALEGLGRRNFVLAFWHGSMVVGWYLHRTLDMRALVSRSNDGEILAAVLERWGYGLIRGSSHRGGKEAMQMMIDEVGSGTRLAVTPDGPTGPPRVMKIGAVRAAQQGDAPLVLVSIHCDRAHTLGSWDSFQIPYPFSRVRVRYLGPTVIDRSLDGDVLTRKVRDLESEWKNADNQWRS